MTSLLTTSCHKLDSSVTLIHMFNPWLRSNISTVWIFSNVSIDFYSNANPFVWATSISYQNCFNSCQLDSPPLRLDFSSPFTKMHLEWFFKSEDLIMYLFLSYACLKIILHNILIKALPLLTFACHISLMPCHSFPCQYQWSSLHCTFPKFFFPLFKKSHALNLLHWFHNTHIVFQ